MALDFQKIPVIFSGGIDTKTDRKMVLPGKLITLENGVFRSANTIDKRFGYDKLSLSISGADSITSGYALSTFKNELLLFSGTRAYSRLTSTNNWADRGSVISLIQKTTPIVSNGDQQLNPDMTSNSGVSVYAWEDSRDHGTIRYSVVDEETGSFIVANQLVSTSGSHPKLTSLANHIYLFYADGGSIKYLTINVKVPSVLSNEYIFTSNMDINYPAYDVVTNADRIFVSFTNNTSPNGSSVAYLTTAGVISNEATRPGKSLAICNFADKDQNVWTARYDGYAIYASGRSYNLGGLLATHLVESVSGVSTVTGIISPNNVPTLFYDCVDESGTMYIKSTTFTPAGTAGTPTVFCRSVGLASKPFIYDNKLYLNVAYESLLQSTYFTLDSTGNVVAKMLAGVAGGYRQNNTLPQVCQLTPGIFIFANNQKGRIVSEQNTIFSLLGVSSTKLDYLNANNFLTSELGDNLYIVGGIVQSYDGVSFAEHNFNLYPDSSFISIEGNSSPTAALDTTPPSITITGAA